VEPLRRCAFKKAFTAPILSQMFLLIGLVNSVCISLGQSLKCPELKEYSIDSFQGVSNAQEFDQYIESNAAFNFVRMCPTFVKDVPIRYSASFACAYAVYWSTTQKKCNQDLASPKLLCKNSIQFAFQDVEQQLKEVPCF
jgi:hypothetical protein